VQQTYRSAYGRIGRDITGAQRIQERQAAARADPVVLLVVLALVVFGMIMVQSASQFANPEDPTALFRRDALWVTLGAVAMLATARVDYHHWRRVATPVAIGALALVAAVLKLGTSVGGGQRWLSIGAGITVQPSEMAKLAFILFAAHRLSSERSLSPRDRFLPVALLAAALLGCVLLQNDLGTTLVLAAIAFSMIFLAGPPWRWFLPIGAATVLLGTLVIAATPFRRARILAFLHPMACGVANGYQICQSLIAIGSGGIFGRGLGDGLQKAGYLPAPYTDSIFAVIGEELGLWGGLLVIALFALLLWQGARVARAAPDALGTLMASGIVCWLIVQAVLNIGSSVAAMPFTGVPLPFISYGGSSLVVAMAGVGILLNISRHARR
jgi:cell division protein FtsW